MSDSKQENEDNSIKRNQTHDDTNGKLVRKSDIVLLVVVLVIALVALGYVMLTKKPGARVQISIEGEVVEVFDLSKDREYQVTTEKGNNLIVIKGGEVSVTTADCPDKVCVNHTPIDDVGETIICLPHKLVVEIVE